ncbi:hypothetical protein DRQ26_03260 [bacterium]|nr:MAG: hypothetical protein DRQ26_03260 [bacterium]
MAISPLPQGDGFLCQNSMKRILVVDDDVGLLEKFRYLHDRYKKYFELLTAENGKEAVKILGGTEIDLVITGLSMPEMDGFELLAYLNKDYPKIRVIVMADVESQMFKARIKTLGSAICFEKPVDLSALTHKVFTELQINYGGEVRCIGLSSFLQMLKLEGKSCTLTIKTGCNTGLLYLKDGDLIAAETGTLNSEEAACKIIGWDDPVIEIDYTPIKKEKEINFSLINILIESQRIRDEEKSESKNKRKHARFNCLVAVDYDIKDWSYQNFMRNLSLGGAFIETKNSIPVGQRILMSFSAANESVRCNIAGKVVRRTSDGFGVKFEQLSSQQSNVIKMIVEQDK